MFNNDRYISKGIQQTTPLELQLFMWSCIHKLKSQNYKLDYLQIFVLTKMKIDNIFLQEITHSQEMPVFKKAYRLLTNQTVYSKVFVIDNGEFSTMLLSEEY